MRPKKVEVTGVRQHTVQGSTVSLLCKVNSTELSAEINMFNYPVFVSLERCFIFVAKGEKREIEKKERAQKISKNFVQKKKKKKEKIVEFHYRWLASNFGHIHILHSLYFKELDEIIALERVQK